MKKKSMNMTVESKGKVKSMRTKIGLAVIACMLITAFAVGGVSAYFTDGDTVTNTFTVGKISLDLQEPNWNPEEGENMTPNQTVDKDPQIYNDGINKEFVFMEVIVPYDNLVTANGNGTLNAAAMTELYHYQVNDGWHQLSRTQNKEKKTVTYLYVYGSERACTELAAGKTTPTLFDRVTFANVVEDQALEGKTLAIVVNAYGIQTSDINGGKTTPADVWAVLANQLPSTVK